MPVLHTISCHRARTAHLGAIIVMCTSIRACSAIAIRNPLVSGRKRGLAPYSLHPSAAMSTSLVITDSILPSFVFLSTLSLFPLEQTSYGFATLISYRLYDLVSIAARILWRRVARFFYVHAFPHSYMKPFSEVLGHTTSACGSTVTLFGYSLCTYVFPDSHALLYHFVSPTALFLVCRLS